MNWTEIMEYYISITTERYNLLSRAMDVLMAFLAVCVIMSAITDDTMWFVGLGLSLTAVFSIAGHQGMCLIYQRKQNLLLAVAMWSGAHTVALILFTGMMFAVK